jgi:hypothetical protein
MTVLASGVGGTGGESAKKGGIKRGILKYILQAWEYKK